MSAAPATPPEGSPNVRPPYNERYHPFFDEAMKEQSNEEQLREARLKWWNNGLAKCKQNPFVPIGIAATCYAMYGAVRSMRAGNSAQLQKFFRLRVGAQAFAILAMLGGGMYFDGADPLKSLGTIPDTVKRSRAKPEEKKQAKETVYEAPGEHAEATDEPVKKALPKLSPTKFTPPRLNVSNNSTSANDPASNNWAGETKEERVVRMTEALEAKRKDALRENERQRERLTGKVRVAVDDI
ncbi:mitochondrial hypoxia responsive domain protein [Phaffia rhodozyma]|uniref:Mitochondrial hypoxia responsive domain protein n=1 Tax=Phaffia rhodozyma TaxID=264483 RepID=A0A0F7SUU4_PHARH|nr:mitochondrial hypoxia responsive domain protein [Phaffia rhodozyma]